MSTEQTQSNWFFYPNNLKTDRDCELFNELDCMDICAQIHCVYNNIPLCLYRDEHKVWLKVLSFTLSRLNSLLTKWIINENTSMIISWSLLHIVYFFILYLYIIFLTSGCRTDGGGGGAVWDPCRKPKNWTNSWPSDEKLEDHLSYFNSSWLSDPNTKWF